MKRYSIKYQIFIKFLALSFLGVMFLASCSDKDTIGAPEITNVRPLDPTQANIVLDTVALGQWIVVQGNNFSGLQKVYFNKAEATFNSTMATDNNIVVYVPNSTPNFATRPDSAFNELKVVTKTGVAIYQLAVLPPPPYLDSISCEFPADGQTITIYGQYFYFVKSVTFPGGKLGTSIKTSTDGTTCTVKVPSGVGIGPLVVQSQSGTSSVRHFCTLNDTSGIFFNCEKTNEINLQGTNGVQGYDGVTNPDIPSCRGKYALCFTLDVPSGVSWLVPSAFESNFKGSSFTWPDYPLATPGTDLELRFEVYIKDSWPCGAYELAFLSSDADDQWKDAYRFYFSAPVKKTTSWRTVTIPLSRFLVNSETKNTTSLIGTYPVTYEKIKGMAFNFNFKNTSADAGGVTIPVLNIAMDNFRIVKIK